MIWAILRPFLPYLIGAGAIYGAWWYVGSLRAEIAQQRADLEAANDKVAKAHANIRQRIDAERKQREVNDESARLARMARDRVHDTTRRLREFRTADVPAVAASVPDSAGDCKPAVPVAAVVAERAESRTAEIELACAATDADLSVLAAEIRRLDRALGDLKNSEQQRQPD